MVLAMGLFSLYFSWFSIRKAAVFDWYSSDLGNMWQTVWNVGHGHGFTFTSTGLGQNVSRLAVHADYLLILLAPLSWITRSASSLLIVQAAVVAAGGWFVYRLAWLVVRQRPFAVLAGLAYLTYGPLQLAVVWQFHAVTLASTFILASAEAIIAGRRSGIFWLWFGLALISKEQIGLLIGPASFLLWWLRRSPSVAWASLLVGISYSLVHFWWVIPTFQPAGAKGLLMNYYFGTLGHSPVAQLSSLLNPSILMARLWRPAMLTTTALLLVPLAALPVFSRWIWLAVVALLPHWLSSVAEARSVEFHNHVLAIPFLFLGLVFGWRWWQQRLRRRPVGRTALAAALAAMTIFGSVLVSPNPWSLYFKPHSLDDDPKLTSFAQLVEGLPTAAVVSYSLGIGQYVRSRQTAYLLPDGLTSSDYAVLYWPAEPRPADPPMVNQQQNLLVWQDYFARSAAFVAVARHERGTVFQRLRHRQPEPLPPIFADYLNGPRTI
ncbi:MAG: DUF2079 domain-containing protein [Candidatus Kerfeldbacteria bacterium]|nr:DUF2079 domain-containing protein [Candidatus Kerfeldbacteria bacterium]